MLDIMLGVEISGKGGNQSVQTRRGPGRRMGLFEFRARSVSSLVFRLFLNPGEILLRFSDFVTLSKVLLKLSSLLLLFERATVVVEIMEK